MTSSRRTFVACLCFVLVVFLSAVSQAEVTLESLLKEMIDGDAIARWPQPEYTCKQASSYDRQTTASDKPGWFANQDHTQYVRAETNDGRREQVMLDIDGPGALVRFWLTTGNENKGVLRVYLDGSRQPALTFPKFDLLAGDLVVPKPLAEAHPGYGPNGGGNNLYLPIPYSKHCKVTWEEQSSGPRYYQINYRTYAAGTQVKTFELSQYHAARTLIDLVIRTLSLMTREADRTTPESAIEPGGNIGVEFSDGPLAITDIELRVKPGQTELAEQDLRSLIVILTFDGEVTAWCPASDFFGSGVGLNPLRSWNRTVDIQGTMHSSWVMPFQKTAKVSVVNLGERSVQAELQVQTKPWTWDDRSMYFHSTWHYESGLKTPPDRDWNFVRINGKGVYAGDSLALFNSVSTWYGEGDEKIRVDGEAFPSHLGTGTEDYYGYSFAPQGIIQTPFNNQVRIDEPMTQGHNVLSRTRSLDGIPFRKSFEFDMELIAWKPTTLTYAGTTYWYALPGATTNVPPDPVNAVRPIPTLEQVRAVELAKRPQKPGVIECETMKVVDKSEGLVVGPQDMSPWGVERWSRGEHLLAAAKSVGSFYELEVPAPNRLPRQVVVSATQAPDYGILKFAVNGQTSDETFDGYASKVQPGEPIKLGIFPPDKGKFRIRVTVAGANPKSESLRYLFALDAIALEDPSLCTVHSQPSLQMTSSQIELSITQLGGHMSPVTFYRDTDHSVQPYYVSPWQDEPPLPMPAPVLVPLRGDFFCLPFGGNSEVVDGEKHPPHGETASSRWESHGIIRQGPKQTLTMSLETKVRKGRVTKELSLVDGQNVVYLKHTIEGFAGRVPLGHHATLAMPDQTGAVRLASSPIRFGMTYPGLFSDPAQREYQSLLPGTKWTDLTKVPLAWKDQPDADLSRLPARTGHADLVQIFNEPWEKSNGPAWMSATFAEGGYTWFSLKDADVLRSTVFWIENHGRHGHPWNGRNNCLGLEDVTAYFADGLAASMNENRLKREGIPTTAELKSNGATSINYIQGVVKIPAGFDVVKSMEFGPGQLTLVSSSGERVIALVNHDFIKTGKLPE